MQKNISKSLFYVIAVSATVKETNKDINLFVMAGDTSETWFTTTNIGEAFMFFDQDVARLVAKQLKDVLKDNDEFTANNLVILAVEFNINESEVILLEH